MSLPGQNFGGLGSMGYYYNPFMQSMKGYPQMPMFSPLYSQMMFGYPGMPPTKKEENVGGKHRGSRHAEFDHVTFANLDLVRTKVRTEFYPFLNEQLKELV
jgi:hypothetical protein